MTSTNILGALWQFPENVQSLIIETHLSRYGRMISSQPYSKQTRIVMFDRGEQSSPRYFVAKGLVTDAEDPQRIAKAKHILDEFLNVYRVSHHSLIQKYGYIEFIHGVPFLIGRKREMTLWDLIEMGPIAAVDTLAIAVQVVHALRYCQERGIDAHQDLKPENIFIDSTKHIQSTTGMPYPIRYLAYVADLELADAYRRSDIPFGSRPYMPPEQHEAAKKVGVKGGIDFSKVDVFAIGVILVEMLTGGVHPVGERRSLIWPTQSPGYEKWKRETPWKQWIRSGAQISAAILDLDRPLAAIVRQCLAPYPERINKESLELLLSQELASRDENVWQTLNLLLVLADSGAEGNAAAGWPYYDDLKERIEGFFASAC
jgi:eukaryotic-like serine/threonine-protein kinase